MKFDIKGLRDKIQDVKDGADDFELYEYFVEKWVEYTNNGGELDDILNALSKKELVLIFFKYLQHHG